METWLHLVGVCWIGGGESDLAVGAAQTFDLPLLCARKFFGLGGSRGVVSPGEKRGETVVLEMRMRPKIACFTHNDHAAVVVIYASGLPQAARSRWRYN